MQISDADCAILFDQDDCDMSSNLLKVKDGEQGRLGTRLGTLFTKKLKRNDLEVIFSVFCVFWNLEVNTMLQSLIVKAHCRLELWDDDDGIDKGAKPDFVLDNTVMKNIFILLFLDFLFSTSLHQNILTALKRFRQLNTWTRGYLHTGIAPPPTHTH